MSISQAAMLFLAIIAIVYLFLKCGKAFTVLIAIGAILLIGIGALVFSFQGFNNQVLVATVQASAVQNMPHEMAVSLTTYDGNGNPTRYEYELGGDRFMLQSEVVEFQPWLLFLGARSGYHLSRLSGEYNGSIAGSKPVQLGSWNFFNSLENNVGLFFPVVKSAYSSAVIDPPGTYNIFVDNVGDLSANRA